MSQELIYTSLPRGLKPGSHGFCTVACTQGMGPAMAQRLEALSGYRHVYAPQDPNASLNPVVYSHLVLSVGGRRCYVLSRICDAGLDYTQRTNKLAHHVVLDASELPPAGPAWLLADLGFMQATWQGEPGVLPARRVAPSECPPGVCYAWQRATGDAGWGGVLAEAAHANRPAVVIFRPGMDLLPLLAESLALLPREARWKVSFSTYYTKLPPGVDCQWRCVLDGSPEAGAARRLPNAVVINLCAPVGAAVGGAYVEAARTGMAPVAAAPRQAPVLPVRPARPGTMVDGAELDRLSRSSPEVAGTPVAAGAVVAPPGLGPIDDGIYSIGPPALAGTTPVPPPMRTFRQKKKSRKPLAWWGITAAILFLAGAAAMMVFFVVRPAKHAETQIAQGIGQNDADGEKAAARTTTSKIADVPPNKKSEKTNGGDSQSASKTTPKASEVTAKTKVDSVPTKTNVPKDSGNKTSAGSSPSGEVEKPTLPAKEPNPGKPDQVADKNPEPKPPKPPSSEEILAKLPHQIQLPDSAQSSPPPGNPVGLGNNTQWANCRLELVGGDDILGRGNYRFDPVSGKPSGLFRLKRVGVGADFALAATIELSGYDVKCKWELIGGATACSPDLLRNCALRVNIENGSKSIALRRPVLSGPFSFPVIDLKCKKAKPATKEIRFLPDNKVRLHVQVTNATDLSGLNQSPDEQALPHYPQTYIDMGGKQKVHFKLIAAREGDKLVVSLSYEGTELGGTWDAKALGALPVPKTQRHLISAGQVNAESEEVSEAKQNSLEEKVQELGKQLGNLKDKEKKEEKKKKEEEIKSTNKQIERLKAHRPEVVELKTTFDKLKAARLHYRVYIEFTDGQNKPAKVTLMSSDANTVGNQPVQ